MVFEQDVQLGHWYLRHKIFNKKKKERTTNGCRLRKINCSQRVCIEGKRWDWVDCITCDVWYVRTRTWRVANNKLISDRRSLILTPMHRPVSLIACAKYSFLLFLCFYYIFVSSLMCDGSDGDCLKLICACLQKKNPKPKPRKISFSCGRIVWPFDACAHFTRRLCVIFFLSTNFAWTCSETLRIKWNKIKGNATNWDTKFQVVFSATWIEQVKFIRHESAQNIFEILCRSERKYVGRSRYGELCWYEQKKKWFKVKQQRK